MPKLPYGFDPLHRHIDDDPWTNLKTINEFLEDGEPIPPDLAQWLGLAIRFSENDPDKLMRRLGLKRGRGRQSHKHAEDAWLKWGGRVHDHEARGVLPETAIQAVAQDYLNETNIEVSRADLQKWRETYRAALHAE